MVDEGLRHVGRAAWVGLQLRPFVAVRWSAMNCTCQPLRCTHAARMLRSSTVALQGHAQQACTHVERRAYAARMLRPSASALQSHAQQACAQVEMHSALPTSLALQCQAVPGHAEKPAQLFFLPGAAQPVTISTVAQPGTVTPSRGHAAQPAQLFFFQQLHSP
eukprot:395548-Pelagomonas_calceolata.AAC.3